VPVLDVPDAFQIEVPDGWQPTVVSASEYTLSDGGGLQLTIVVYAARDKKEALAATSTAAVREWAWNIGVQDAKSLTVLTPTGGDTPRAFASMSRDDRNVYVGFFYFKKCFVVAAGSAPATDRAGFTQVERLIWSIEAA